MARELGREREILLSSTVLSTFAIVTFTLETSMIYLAINFLFCSKNTFLMHTFK